MEPKSQGFLSHQQLIEYHNLMYRDDIIMYYKGPFDESIISKMIAHVRSKFGESKTGHKLFSIFMELAQNISFYSAEKNILYDSPATGVGMMIIQEQEASYTLATSNMVDASKVDALVDRLEEIQSLDADGLRDLKKRLRTQSIEEGKTRGGNIGLVQAALKADYPLSFEANKISEEESLLTIFATVKK